MERYKALRLIVSRLLEGAHDTCCFVKVLTKSRYVKSLCVRFRLNTTRLERMYTLILQVGECLNILIYNNCKEDLYFCFLFFFCYFVHGDFIFQLIFVKLFMYDFCSKYFMYIRKYSLYAFANS